MKGFALMVFAMATIMVTVNGFDVVEYLWNAGERNYAILTGLVHLIAVGTGFWLFIWTLHSETFPPGKPKEEEE